MRSGMSLLFSFIILSSISLSFLNLLSLGDSDFKNELASRKQLFVKFFAPWCGHCKNLAPTWDKLAQNPEVNQHVTVVKVDCTDKGKETCKDYGVKGFPTLKFISLDVNGNEQIVDYNGDRKEDSLIQFALKYSRPALKEVSEAEIEALIKSKSNPAVVGFFSTKGDIYKRFEEATSSLKTHFDFAYTISPTAHIKYQQSLDTVCLFRQPYLQTPLEPNVHCSDDFSDLSNFLKKNKHGLTGYRSSTNEDDFAKPLVVVFFDVDPHLQSSKFRLIRNRVIGVAKAFTDLTFAVSPVIGYQNVVSDIFTYEQKGIYVVIYDERDQKFPLRQNFSVDSANEFQKGLNEFVSDFVSGKISEPFVKSEPIPEFAGGHVKVVVGKTFSDVVFDESKDVLIEMYAPWCGHCKKLEPIYDELAEKLKDEKNLVIAKMDATQNDFPGSYSVSGFPTIYFAKIGQKSAPLKYDGDRDVPSFIKWLESHSTHPLQYQSKDQSEL